MKFYGIAALLVAAMMTTACSSYFYGTPQAKLPSRHQLCAHLRQQMIYQNNYNGPNMMRSTPINRARVSNDYQRYNCSEFETPPAE